MNSPTADAIASELEAFLRDNFQIPEDDAHFTRTVNLWEEGYVDSAGVVETIVHLERRWGVELPKDVVFDPRFTHVAGIAELVAALIGGGSNLTDRQLLLWLDQQLAPEIPSMNQIATFRIDPTAEFDAARFERAFAAVVERSDALRTVFEESRDGARQSVRADIVGVVGHVDLSGAPDPELEFGRWFDERRQRRFQLDQRAFDSVLVRLGGTRIIWYLCLHHLITDAASLVLIYRETMTAYLTGTAHALPQFAEHLAGAASRRNSLQHAASTDFWRRRLAERLEPVRFYGRPNPKTTSYSRRRTVTLSPEHIEGLRKVSHESVGAVSRGQELATAFIGLTLAYVRRVSHNGRIGAGVFVANRSSKRARETIGLFMELPQVRAELDENTTFATLLEEVQRDLHTVLQHSRTCFSNPSRQPAYEVMVNFQTARFPALLGPTRTSLDIGTTGFEGDFVPPVEESSTAAPFGITVHDYDGTGELAVSFDFNRAVFDQAGCDRAVSHFLALLDACIADPSQRVDGVDLVSEPERQQLRDFSETQAPPVPDQTVVEMIESQARRTPVAIAVRCGESAVDYADLVRRVDALAGRLRQRGLRIEDRVAVRLDRSIELLVALIAIWKAGGASVPLDPAHPASRTAQILEDAAPRFLLTSTTLRPSLETGPGVTVVCLDAPDAPRAATAARRAPEPAELRADRLAYVLFTSGSTGRPKGIEVAHQALTNFLLSMARQPGLTAADRVLALTTVAFDIAALELYLPLIVGATVDLVTAQTAMDARQLKARMEKMSITFMQATPGTWRMLIDAGWRGRRGLRIVCGGEALAPDLAEQLLARASEVWNAYGPTETTVWSTLHRVRAPLADDVPIGRPIDNTTVYVLGPDRVPVPIGVQGELYIGGAGLARGYTGQPERTRERFVADPFSERPGARMYRTGDRASFSDDGNLHCHGRIDRQIKLRGFRIEPAEIEAAIRTVSGVKDVFVTAQDVSGQRELCAYWTGEARQEALFAAARALLPGYLIPSRYVAVPTFPLDTNGKLNVAALPPVSSSALAAEVGLRPRNDIEQRIAAIWSQVLGLSPIPVDRDFFALGGTSVKVLETRSRIEQSFGVELPLAPFFESPATVARLAARIANPALNGSLVILQRGDDGAPLFLIHAADGATLPYAKLARELAGRRRVYGIQPLASDDLPMVHTRIEEMAAHYVSVIRDAQPKGPYLLGGLCVGAVIACEMARLLEAEHEEVRLLLFDAADPFAAPKPYLQAWRRVERVRRLLLECNVRNLPRVLARKLVGFARFEWHLASQWVHGRLAVAAIRVCRPRRLPLPRWARRLPVKTICALAVQEYRTTHVVHEEIVLFRGTSGIDADEPFAQKYDDPLLGWQARTAKGVRSIDVPGGHLSMLQEPHVTVLAERLRELLDESASPEPQPSDTLGTSFARSHAHG